MSRASVLFVMCWYADNNKTDTKLQLYSVQDIPPPPSSEQDVEWQ